MKLIKYGVAAAVSVVFTACGGGDDDGADAAPESTPTDGVTIDPDSPLVDMTDDESSFWDALNATSDDLSDDEWTEVCADVDNGGMDAAVAAGREVWESGDNQGLAFSDELYALYLELECDWRTD